MSLRAIACVSVFFANLEERNTKILKARSEGKRACVIVCECVGPDFRRFRRAKKRDETGGGLGSISG